MNRKAKYLLFVFLQFLVVLNASKWGMGPGGMGPGGMGPGGMGPGGMGPGEMGPMQEEGGMNPYEGEGAGPMSNPSMYENPYNQYPQYPMSEEEESAESYPGPNKNAVKDPYYAAVCTAKDRCVTTCPADYQDGCVCYNSGICLEQAVSRCHQCTDPDVYAVFEGKSCPRRHPIHRHKEWCYRGHHRGYHRHHRREWESEGFAPFFDCKEKVNSCVCKKNGECSMKLLSLCDQCREKHHYLAIFLNATCPDTSLNATCNATEGANPAPTTCNDPYAYLCQAQDRNSTQCNLESSAQACVCYTNGTCISQPASACACQRDDIVSVYTGGFCPTNCTGTPPAPLQPSEEQSEEQSEGKSEEQPESETENEESTESEEESSETSPMNSFDDEFLPSNPYRFFNCSIPQAYQCQDSDRNATNCSVAAQQTCICNTEGICISVISNRCNACSKSEIASVYEGGYCPSNCSTPSPAAGNQTANNQTSNSTESEESAEESAENSQAAKNQTGNSTESEESAEESAETSPAANNQTANSTESEESSETSNNSSNSSLTPATANVLPPANNSTVPETGAGGSAPVQPTAAVPAQNNLDGNQSPQDAVNGQNATLPTPPTPQPREAAQVDSNPPNLDTASANNISNSTLPKKNTSPLGNELSKPADFPDVNPIKPAA